MTKNISYKQVICDICGKEERIDQSKDLPPKWEELKCGWHFKYDCCPECIQNLKTTIEEIKKNNTRPKIVITKDGCIRVED